MKDEIKFLGEILLLTVPCDNEVSYEKSAHFGYILANERHFKVYFVKLVFN